MIEYRINLRQWRDERRQQRNRALWTYLFLSLLLGAAVAYVWGMTLGKRAEQLQASIRLLQSETRKHKPKADKVKNLEKQYDDLKRRMSVLQKLERDRVAAAHLWRLLPGLLPERTYFQNLQRQGTGIEITGMAPSIEAANELAMAASSSCYLIDARITDQDTRRRDAFGNSVWFKLVATEKRPSPGECPHAD